ncbi:MAG: AMP-binding protein [Solirubrobacterales bacterium]
MIYQAELPAPEVPDATLDVHVLGDAATRAERPALVDGPSGTVMTYGELDSRVDAVAAGLQDAGVGKGDVVALIGPNGAEWAIAYFAILRAGGVVTPINPLLTPDEVEKQVGDSNAKLTLKPDDVADLAKAGAKPDPVEGGPDELAILPYSSGTTGAMKGVMLTHRNLVANIEQTHAHLPIGDEDTLVGVLPFFHIYGQTVVLNLGLAKGAAIVTMPRFDLEGLLGIMEGHKVTWLHIAPPVVLAFANVPGIEDRDFSALKLVISGAAPLDEELALRAEERIGAPIRQGYGMTELSPVSHKSPIAKAAGTPPGSVGPLLPGTEARLVDPESGEDVAAGEPGEIWVRGPQVMRGYLGNEEATRETLTEDGWLRTGDIGRVDEDGNFYIVDRLKELIKYKGYQVPPAELEAVLVGHPKVRDAGVVGVPDADGEEYPKAFVVGEEIDADEVIAYVAERVAPYKKVREVEVIDEIPKSASGKILRRVLRDRAGA